MSSPYFMQSSAVLTRSSSHGAGGGSAASLRSKLSSRQGDVDAVPARKVKVEAEEATVSEEKPSLTPSSSGMFTLGSPETLTL